MVHIYKRVLLYSRFKKYASQVLYEVQLRDKSKIDGAYLLLKRYKNRLKNFDSALERIYEIKADKSQVEKIEEQSKPERAISVFKDMKMLLDATTKQFEERLQREMTKIQTQYGKLLQEQKQAVYDIENHYSHQIGSKIQGMEDFMNEIALEQAKMKEKYNGANREQFVNKSSLFPLQNTSLSKFHASTVEDEVKVLKYTVENIKSEQEDT